VRRCRRAGIIRRTHVPLPYGKYRRVAWKNKPMKARTAEMGYADANTLVCRSNSFQCIDTLLSLRSRMDHQEWVRLVGTHWSRCDGLRKYRLTLRRLLGTEGPIRSMMTAAENVAYDGLPELVTVTGGVMADTRAAQVGAWSAPWQTISHTLTDTSHPRLSLLPRLQRNEIF
jgi:hypothetical protein